MMKLKQLYIYLLLVLSLSFLLSVWSCSNVSDSESLDISKTAHITDTILDNDSTIYAELQILDDSARYNLLRGQYSQAFPFLFEGFRYWHELEKRKGASDTLNLKIGQWYYNTGFGYFFLTDYSNALFYLNMAAEYTTAKSENHQILQAKIHNLLGFTYRNLEEPDNAIVHLEQALQTNLKLYGAIHRQVGIVYNSLGYVYFDAKEYVKAAETFLKAFKIFEELEFIHDMAVTAGNIANALVEDSQKYDNAIYYAQKGVELAKQNNGATSLTIAYAYSMLATIYGGVGDIEQGLSTLQIEMAYLADEKPNMDISYHPEFDLEKLRMVHVIALSNKAELLRTKYQNTQEPQYLLKVCSMHLIY